MSTNCPIVPRCADCTPRVFIFHRASGAEFGSDEARIAFADFQRRVDGLLDALCCGPGAVTLLSITGSGTGDDEAALATLMRAIDTRRCDALIVESFTHVSRDTRKLWQFMAGLGQTGIRLLALDDRFDSAVDSFDAAFGTPPVDGAGVHVALNDST